ncbi:hypothetical protein ACOSQ3_020788 [Xanthoceras sorbifolium]
MIFKDFNFGVWLRATSPPRGAARKARKESSKWTNRNKSPPKPSSSQSPQRSKFAGDKAEVPTASCVDDRSTMYYRLTGSSYGQSGCCKRMISDGVVSESNGSKRGKMQQEEVHAWSASFTANFNAANLVPRFVGRCPQHVQVWSKPPVSSFKLNSDDAMSLSSN